MIKKISLRKLGVTLCAVIVILLLNIFPNNSLDIEKNLYYVDTSTYSEVFLIDNYNYVSMVNLEITKNDLNERLKEKIDCITIGSTKQIPNTFKKIIPKNTKVLSLIIDNDIVKINFSKELLSISTEDEEKLIEAIIFTLTSEKEIKKIIISVEDKILERLPNSNKLLPSTLDRTYGINRDYDINNLYNLTKTTIYFIREYNENTYYVPVTKVTNSNEEKVTLIINELKSSVLYQSNLNSYLNNNAELKNYEITENVINLTFNETLFNSIYDENIIEEVMYTIAYSMLDNYEVKKVNIYVNEEKVFSSK